MKNKAVFSRNYTLSEIIVKIRTVECNLSFTI